MKLQLKDDIGKYRGEYQRNTGENASKTVVDTSGESKCSRRRRQVTTGATCGPGDSDGAYSTWTIQGVASSH